jgi:predicted P-loop ATPase
MGKDIEILKNTQTQLKNTLLDAALKYHAAGLRVTTWEDNPAPEKRWSAWAKFRDGQTADQVRGVFNRQVDRLAILTGVDDLEAIDIDTKHDPKGTIYQEFIDLIQQDETAAAALGKCVIVRTKSGGWHYIYRAGNLEKSQKLAHREGVTEAVIETRGIGGLLFCAPSPGYGVAKGCYTQIQRLSDDERTALITCARLLSHRMEAEPMPDGKAYSTGTDRPGDRFNSENNILDITGKYGWREVGKSGDYIHLNRPGAKNPKGVDASCIPSKNLFYPFSTSTKYDAGKCYSPFDMLTLEDHNGDFSAAARALVQKNGSPAKEKKSAKKVSEEKQSNSDHKLTKIEEIENHLKAKGYIIRYNSVKNAVEIQQGEGQDWRDVDERTGRMLESELLRRGLNGVEKTLNVVLATAPDYDPMVEFLKIYKWDGVDHIQRLAGFVIVDDDRRAWFDLMFKKHMVRLIACAIGRLPFNKQAFILFGSQGDGKSSFLRFIIPILLKAYYTEQIDFESKDGLIALARNYVINLDELTSLSRHDITKIKAFLSYQGVKARLPFDRRETNLRRRATFFGSTNKEEFLTDETGNVRWLVMPIKGINHDNGGPNGYTQVDINQVYAQAFALLESGFEYELSAEELAMSERHNSGHLKKPNEYEMILQYYEPSQDKEDFRTASEVKNYLQIQTTHKITAAEMIGRSLQMLNNESAEKWKYAKVTRRVGGIPLKGYLLREMGERRLPDDEK